MGSCSSPRSGGRARCAWTAAGDGEFTGEEAAGEEALGPEAIAIGLGLNLVLDKEEVTAERIPGSDDDGEGQRWPTIVSRGGQSGVE
jgi:hypothetical protein